MEPLQFQDPLVVAEEVVEQYFTAQITVSAGTHPVVVGVYGNGNAGNNNAGPNGQGGAMAVHQA